MTSILKGGELRKLRKNLRLSLREVGAKTGISFGHLCDMENGNMNPTLDTFVRLCDFYHVKADFLLVRNG